MKRRWLLLGALGGMAASCAGAFFWIRSLADRAGDFISDLIHGS